MYPLIPLTPALGIPTYYLILSITVCIALWWAAKRTTRYSVSKKITLDLGLIIMVSGFIGGRLFHVFYEDFAYYKDSMFRVLEFWNGGFVFYGGALLAGVCGFLFLKKQDDRNLRHYLDLLAPVLSLSYALGRVACLLAGCCYGRYCELAWAVEGRHPTQAYASLWELGVLFILLGIEKEEPAKRKPAVLARPGSLFFMWMILHALGRFMVESFRDDFRGPQFGLSISSWISIAILIAGIYLLFKSPRNRAL